MGIAEICLLTIAVDFQAVLLESCFCNPFLLLPGFVLFFRVDL